jgi:hypothetical protein
MPFHNQVAVSKQPEKTQHIEEVRKVLNFNIKIST